MNPQTTQKLDAYDIALRELRAEVGDKEFARRTEKYNQYRENWIKPVREQIYMLRYMKGQNELTEKDKEKLSLLQKEWSNHEQIAEAYFFKGYEYLVPLRDDPRPERNRIQQWWHRFKLDWYDWKDKLKARLIWKH